MADARLAIDNMLGNEGWYSSDPDDSGGETIRGISRRSWPRWAGWDLVDLRKRAPDFPRNLRPDLTLARLVSDFYVVNFWSRVRGDDIQDQSVAESIFDYAVNVGVRRASKEAQRIVGTADDGIVGPNTLAALNAFDPTLFGLRYCLSKIDYYVGLAHSRPKDLKFLRGWILRARRHVA